MHSNAIFVQNHSIRNPTWLNIHILIQLKNLSNVIFVQNNSRNASLIQHSYTHTAENPFKCNICSKSFSQKNSLIKRLCSHTVEKPIKCNICTKSFSLKSNMCKYSYSLRAANLSIVIFVQNNYHMIQHTYT